MMDITEKLVVKCAIAILALFGVYLFGAGNGREEIQAKWDKAELDYIAAKDKLIDNHLAAMELQSNIHRDNNIENSVQHEKSISEITAALAAARLDAKRLGGLRISASACQGIQPVTPTETSSDSGHHASTAGTIALPEAIENDLWAAAEYADELVEQARACQGWIRRQGFYGDVRIPAPAD